METETVAARNVVDLLLQDEFGKGICPRAHASEDEGASPAGDKSDEDYVYGWDC